jgi:hypothetical protein
MVVKTKDKNNMSISQSIKPGKKIESAADTYFSSSKKDKNI